MIHSGSTLKSNLLAPAKYLICNSQSMKNLLLILANCLFVISCSQQESATKTYQNMNNEDSDIVGGRNLKYSSAAAATIVHISLENKSGFNKSCTGVFISNRFILTAEHCISFYGTSGMSIHFRRPDYNKTTNVDDLKLVTASTIDFGNSTVVREKFGLIEFSGGLPKHAKSADLSELQTFKTKNIIQNQIFLAVGYGRNTGSTDLDPLESDGSGVLRAKVLNASLLEKKSETFKVDQDKNKGGVCFGDSGGPALVLNKITGRYKLIGIASAVDTTRTLTKSKVKIDPSDSCRNESIYLNVAAALPEIKKAIQSDIVR